MHLPVVCLLIALLGIPATFAFYEVEVSEVEAKFESHGNRRPSVEPGTCCFTPLYRYYDDKNHYTTSIVEMYKVVVNSPTLNLGTVGVVAKKEDCGCPDGALLVPVTRYVKAGGGTVFSSYAAEGQELERSGYVNGGVAFYCADKPGQCGAKHALYKYQKSGAEEYTYSNDFETGNEYIAKHSYLRKNIVCYTWGEAISPLPAVAAAAQTG